MQKCYFLFGWHFLSQAWGQSVWEEIVQVNSSNSVYWRHFTQVIHLYMHIDIPLNLLKLGSEQKKSQSKRYSILPQSASSLPSTHSSIPSHCHLVGIHCVLSAHWKWRGPHTLPVAVGKNIVHEFPWNFVRRKLHIIINYIIVLFFIHSFIHLWTL